MASSRFLFIMIALFFLSCSTNLTNRQDVFTYINDPKSGLVQIKQMGDLKVLMSYYPPELVANQIGRQDRSPDLLNDFSDKVYFKLSFSNNGKELLPQLSSQSYATVLEVFSFRMSSYISLNMKGAASVEPLDCLFEQTYGMSEANHLLVVFDRSSIRSQDFSINIKEFGLGYGNISFDFKKKDIDLLPNITL